MKEVNLNLKILVLPLASVLVLGLVTILGLKLGISQVKKLQDLIAVAKKNETILGEKEAVLSELGDKITAQTNLATTAFPRKNPSLVVLAQLRRLASEKGLFITNIKAGGEIKDKSGLPRVDIGFDIEGPIEGVLDYANSIKSLAPLCRTDKVDITLSGGAARGSLIVRSFWSDYPTKISTVSEPVKEISEDEKKVLIKLAELNLPSFINLAPSLSSGRVNPFGE